MILKVYRIALLLLATTVFAIFATNCSSDNKTSNPRSNGTVHIDIQSDCLDHLLSTVSDSGYMVLEAVGNDLHIYHFDAYCNCCLEYAVDYQIEDFNIIASESDTGGLCDCYCHFNLRSVVYDLKKGLYNVTLIGIEGDTIGIDTISVTG
jgi:hypothetical protein